MIKLFEPHVNVDEARVFLDDILDTKNLTNVNGGYATKLADEIADRMGFQFGIPCSSGTVAAEVLISSLLKYPRSVNTIHVPLFNYSGLIRMLVDLAPKWNSTINFVGSDETNYSGAFNYAEFRGGDSLWINAYLFGNKGYYDNDARSIGDLSHLTGVNCRDLHLTHAFTSLYPTKNIGAGEGGVVLTNSGNTASDVMTMVSGIAEYPGSYNRRMSELNAAVGYANFQGVEFRLTKTALRYKQIRDLIPGEFMPPDIVYPYMFVINLSGLQDTTIARATLIKDFYDQGVETSFDYYKEPRILRTSDLQEVKYNAERVTQSIDVYAQGLGGYQLSIPCHYRLTESDTEQIGFAVTDILGRAL